MKVLRELETALRIVHRQDEPLSAIVEVRDRGLEVFVKVAPQELLELIEENWERLGQGLHFRVFNRLIDLNWKGEYGLFLEDETTAETATQDTDIFYLETDTRRHPGMLAFEQAQGVSGSWKVRARRIHKEQQPCYLRLIELLPGGDG